MLLQEPATFRSTESPFMYQRKALFWNESSLLKLAKFKADFTAIVLSHGPLICQRSECGAVICWSSERQTFNLVLHLYQLCDNFEFIDRM